MQQRYRRAVRLTKTSDFSSVFNYRCVIRSHHFSVFAKPNDFSAGRLGMTVGRRIAARAVDRNYIKRTIREIFRRNAAGFYGMDVVVQLKHSFSRGTYTRIEKELLGVLEQLHKKCPMS